MSRWETGEKKMSAIADLKVSVSEISSVQREVRVEIPWKEIETRLNTRYNELRRSARPMRGFRKGRVPQWLLVQQFGPQVELDVSQKILSEALIEVLTTDETLAPVSTPEVTEAEPIRRGKPLSFTARIEVRPKLDEVKYEGLQLKRTVQEVAESDIDSEVERIREENATLQAPDPQRPAQKGDVLVLDYEVQIEGKDEPARKTEDQEVELGKGALLNQVEEALYGITVGEEKAIPVDLPEAPGQEDGERKPITFNVTVKDIQEKLLPEADDEFAKDAGHENLAAMREEIKGDLQKKIESMQETSLKDQLIDALCDANPVEVPPSLVQQQADESEAEIARMLQMDIGNLPFDDEQKARMRTQAERKVRAALLLAEVARRAEVDVSDEDLDARLVEIAEQTEQPLPKVRADFGKEDRLEQLRSAMLQQNVVEHVLAKAEIIDQTQEEAEAAEKAAAEAKAEASEQHSADESPEAEEEKAAESEEGASDDEA